ncbi:MAG: hypothetical protein AB7N71_05190, partial [Phycisphaerae bacterium]
GWNSESDQFALDLMKTVESIPPWSVQERFDTMSEVLSDRYLLDENQEQTMRRMLIRTSNEMFQQHSDRIMKYAVEAIQTRAMGDAFTPEQVQRWATLAEPVFLDSRRRLESLSVDFMKQLDPEQQELLARDMGAAFKRMDRMTELGEKWKRGEWTAADWGMERDPIQMSGEQRRAAEEAIANGEASTNPQARQRDDNDADAASGKEQPVAAAPERRPNPPVERGSKKEGDGVQPGDDAWMKYVEAFIDKYQLLHDQAERARQIGQDVINRRDELLRRYETKIAATNSAEAETVLRAKESSLLERLFGQMSRRLDRLPTRAQQREAKPINLPNPLSTAKTAEKP